MNAILRLLAGVLSAVLSVGPAQGAPSLEKEKPCREHPAVTAPCFTLRGRLSMWNGNPTYRIWPVGTRRMLGISEGIFDKPGYSNIPQDLQTKLSWDVNLFGDFVICPFQPDKPGRMRSVCVDSAKNVVIRPRE